MAIKRTLFAKPPHSDRIYSLGGFPASCNTSTSGKSVGLSVWLQAPVLWKSMADVTQCEIQSQAEVSPTACKTMQRTHCIANPRDHNLPSRHTLATPHAPCPQATLPGQTGCTAVYFPIPLPVSGTDCDGEITCEQARVSSLTNWSSSLARRRYGAGDGALCKGEKLWNLQ